MEQRIELQPNCSLSPKAAIFGFAATCLFSLIFELVLVMRGFWPVLPFWGTEMAALGSALYLSLLRRHEGQTVLITDSQISTGDAFQAGCRKTRFCEALVEGCRLPQSAAALGVQLRLTIESRGRAFEVGSFLTEEGRCRVGAALRLFGGRHE